MYDNLKLKYDLSEDEIKKAVRAVSKGDCSRCTYTQLKAIADLLTSGDIEPEKDEYGDYLEVYVLI